MISNSWFPMERRTATSRSRFDMEMDGDLGCDLEIPYLHIETAAKSSSRFHMETGGDLEFPFLFGDGRRSRVPGSMWRRTAISTFAHRCSGCCVSVVRQCLVMEDLWSWSISVSVSGCYVSVRSSGSVWSWKDLCFWPHGT